MIPSLRANQHWGDVRIVAAFVEVVEIEGVVDDLIEILGVKSLFTDLELEDEDDRPDDDDRVDPSPHTWNGELEVDRARVMRQNLLEDRGLLQPRIALRDGEVKLVLTRHPREDLVAVARTERRERAGVVRPAGC